jgi:hypothetical protein
MDMEDYNQKPLLSTDSINWENVSVPNRLTYRIEEWNKINGGMDINMGAQPNWVSLEALQELEII